VPQPQTETPLYERHGMPRRVIQRVFGAVTYVAPGLKPRLQTGLVKAGYSIISTLDAGDDTAFLNYGYAALEGDPATIAIEPEDAPNRYSAQLYHRVAGARDLAGKQVLEVGSGRGGGASFVMRYLRPASMTGVDLVPSAVRYCRRRHRVAGLTFRKGDAEHLPFPDRSFDVVLNVESSHCYPSFPAFLAEVARVLRPGGVFLFADLRPRERVAAMRDDLQARFAIAEEERITPNVLRALELDSDRRTVLIQQKAPRFLHAGLKNFASVKGTPIFDAFATGELEYMRFVLQPRTA